MPPPNPPPTTQRAEPQHCTKIFVSISNSRASSGWRPSERIAFCTAVGAAARFWLCTCPRASRDQAALARLTLEDQSDNAGVSDATIDAFSRFLRCSS